MNAQEEKIRFIKQAQEMYGEGTIITRTEIEELVLVLNCQYPNWFIEENRIARGKFKIPETGYTETVRPVSQVSPEMIKTVKSDDIIVPPEVDPNYVPFGFFSDLEKIVNSKEFFPVNIVGLSGNGKTFMVEQVCAKLNRKLIRINLSAETDEVALVGGPTLENGNIIFKEGPVLKCMREGYVLLLDELDRAKAEILFCIQSIIEGSSFYNKHTGEIIKPKKGFNIISTMNTKGYGACNKFIANILDESFLERFVITIEQDYPNIKIEKQILSKVIDDEEFVDVLCKWSQVIRESFYQNAIDSLISTRRLLHIAKTYKVFKNKQKSIELCLNRFEEEEKLAFLDLYEKICKPEETVVQSENVNSEE